MSNILKNKPIKLFNFKKSIGIENQSILYVLNGKLYFNKPDLNDFVEIDCSQGIVSPGFVDVQVNGLGKCNFWNKPDFDLIDELRIKLAQCGVVAFCPTIITDSKEKVIGSINHLNDYIEKSNSFPGSKIIGIHLEGIFITKYGVHKKEYSVKDLTVENILPYVGKNVVLFTLAPELDITGKAIKLLKGKNILVSIGHTDASYREGMKAINEYGLDTVTHMFNAMRGVNGFSHRITDNPGVHILEEKIQHEDKIDFKNDGILLSLLKSNNVLCMVICDGTHVNKESIMFLKKIKGIKNFSLVSDLVAKDFFEEEKLKGMLGGAQITLDKCVKNIVDWGICTQEEALIVASTTICEKLSAANKMGLGRLKDGENAYITIWDTKKNAVRGTIIGENAFLNF